ncbi:uncharacterized protein TNCV_2406261 [Trichonephila clavipes]|nr:uncharacterized protein TNCV_2406261 [Trichonephila clavipes]
MSEKAQLYHIFVRLEPQVQDYVEVRNPENTVQLLEVLAKSLWIKFHARQYEVREIVIMWKDEVGISVGYLVLIIIEEIGEILKWCVDRVMVEMIIGVTTRYSSGSRKFQKDGFNDRGYQFRKMTVTTIKI